MITSQTDIVDKPRQGLRTGADSGWLLIWIGVFVGYIALRLADITFARPEISVDSHFYFEVADQPFPQMLLGLKPVVAPLLWKLFRSDPAIVIIVQGVVSTVCWGILAFRASMLVRSRRLRIPATILVLALSWQVIYWDRVLLSESISISLLALFIACWLWLFEGWQQRKTLALILVGLLWANARDTNAYLILIPAVLIIGGIIIRRIERLHMVIAFAFLAIFVGAAISASKGVRWVFPYLNIMGQRVLPDAERRSYYAAHGMPVTPALMNMSGQWAASNNGAFYYDPQLQSFRDWVAASGKQTYLADLATHPIKTLMDPLGDLPSLALPAPQTNYTLALAACALLCVLVLAINYRRRGIKRDAKWTMPLALLASVYPSALVVWHGDAMEIARHSLQTGLQLQIGLTLFIFCTANLPFDVRMSVEARSPEPASSTT